ncbi:MAG: TIM barrel protein [Gemmatimonadota bacterium]|nr:TIM barrel protein [Gemmatimonadota bacterium]
MRRRDFLRSGVAGTGALLASAAGATAGEPGGDAGRGRPFRLNYAPHFGMFKAHAGNDPIAQLQFMADEGFRALEDNGMKGRPVAEQERIGRELQRLGMQMGVFVAHTLDWNKPTLASGDPAIRERFLNDIRQSVEVAKRVDAKWMTTVPGVVDPRLDIEYQTAHVIETLKRAADIFEPHGLVMTVETLNTRRDHPGQFLTRIAQAYALCKAVGSPAVKMIFDGYHAQIEEGNLIPNIDLAWDEIAYVQVGDNPGRKEPTTGEINYRNVFAHLHGKGFRGIVGMEHGNSRPGKEGERALIDAYRSVDDFPARG